MSNTRIFSRAVFVLVLFSALTSCHNIKNTRTNYHFWESSELSSKTVAELVFRNSEAFLVLDFKPNYCYRPFGYSTNYIHKKNIYKKTYKNREYSGDYIFTFGAISFNSDSSEILIINTENNLKYILKKNSCGWLLEGAYSISIKKLSFNNSEERMQELSASINKNIHLRDSIINGYDSCALSPILLNKRNEAIGQLLLFRNQ